MKPETSPLADLAITDMHGSFARLHLCLIGLAPAPESVPLDAVFVATTAPLGFELRHPNGEVIVAPAASALPFELVEEAARAIGVWIVEALRPFSLENRQRVQVGTRRGRCVCGRGFACGAHDSARFDATPRAEFSKSFLTRSPPPRFTE